MNEQEFIDRSVELFDEFGLYDCYVAGGSVRDFILGRDIKDIDFYILSKSIIEVQALTTTLRTQGYEKQHTPAYISNEIVSGFTTTVWKKEYVDVMLVQQVANTTKNHINDYINATFDVGLCMCYIDKKGNRYVNEAFLEDKVNNTITFYQRPQLTNTQVYRSISEHIPRIKSKYNYPTRISYCKFNPRWVKLK